MAFPFNDPSQFTPFTNQAGETFQIPNQFTGAFNLPPPPDVTVPSTGGAPAFDLAELPPAQAIAPTAPAPAPAPEPAGMPARVASAGGVPKPQPPTLPLPGAAAARPTPPPETALDVGLDSLVARKDIARQQGEVEARTAAAEADIYSQSDAREAELEKQRQAARDSEAKERQKYQAELKDATDRHVNYKVDENRKWHNRSTGQKLMAGIAVAFSGLGNALAKQGNSSNAAIDFIMSTLKEDAASQRDERAHLGAAVAEKKDALSDLRAQFSDNEAGYQAVLGANAKRVANQIRTMAASAKSETVKLNAANAAAELDAQGASLIDAAEKTEYARKIDDRNFKLQQAQLGEQRAGRVQAGANADRNFQQGQYEFEKNLELQYGKAIAEADKLERAGKADEAKAAREAADKEAKELRNLTIGGGERKVVFGQDGLPKVVNEPLKGADGKPWKAPDLAAPALQKKKAAVDSLVRLMDDTINLMDEHGHEPDFAKSPAWQQAQANWGAMAINEKTIDELGVLAGPDMSLIAKKLGTGDPTALISTIPGIRKGRENTLRQFNTELVGHGYDGKPYEVKEMTRSGALSRAANTPALSAYSAAQRSIRQKDQTNEDWFRANTGQPKRLDPAAAAGASALAKLASTDPAAKDLLVQLAKDNRPEMRAHARAEAAKAGIDLGIQDETSK